MVCVVGSLVTVSVRRDGISSEDAFNIALDSFDDIELVCPKVPIAVVCSNAIVSAFNSKSLVLVTSGLSSDEVIAAELGSSPSVLLEAWTDLPIAAVVTATVSDPRSAVDATLDDPADDSKAMLDVAFCACTVDD